MENTVHLVQVGVQWCNCSGDKTSQTHNGNTTTYWRGSGGTRGAVVPWVTETLRLRKASFAAVPTSLTWLTVLNGISTSLVRVRALSNQIVSSFNNNYVKLNERQLMLMKSDTTA